MKTYFISYIYYIGAREYYANTVLTRKEKQRVLEVIGEWHNVLKIKHRADKLVILFFEVADE